MGLRLRHMRFTMTLMESLLSILLINLRQMNCFLIWGVTFLVKTVWIVILFRIAHSVPNVGKILPTSTSISWSMSHIVEQRLAAQLVRPIAPMGILQMAIPNSTDAWNVTKVVRHARTMILRATSSDVIYARGAIHTCMHPNLNVWKSVMSGFIKWRIQLVTNAYIHAETAWETNIIAHHAI